VHGAVVVDQGAVVELAAAVRDLGDVHGAVVVDLAAAVDLAAVAELAAVVISARCMAPSWSTRAR
jgi:hypothetical protein